MKNEPLFKQPTPEEWRVKAAKDLRTEDLDSLLDWEPFKGIKMGAYYDLHDREKTQYLTSFFSSQRFTGWELLEPVKVTDSKEANNQALEGLNSGATGVLFEVDQVPKDGASLLFNGILPEHCLLAFQGSAADEYSSELINNLGSNASALTGFTVNGKKIWKESPNFRSVGITITNDFDIIPSLVTYLENLQQFLKIFGEQFLEHLNVTIELKDKYFQNMALIRSIRWLTHLFKISRDLDVSSNQLHIHAFTSASSDYKSSMLKNATAGVSGILAGINSVEFGLESPKSEHFDLRIARNAGNLMRDESKLFFDQDPMAGAYFVELLTHIISELSWNQFEEKS